MTRRALPLLVVLAACSPHANSPAAQIDTIPGGIVRVRNHAPSGWSDSTHVTFTEMATLTGEGPTKGEIDEIRDIVVDGGGKIYVAQADPARIDQFGPDGKWIRNVGRAGGGPGEYQQTNLAWTQGFLVVNDPQQARATLFDTAGVFVRSFKSLCCFWDHISADDSGLVYLRAGSVGGTLNGAPIWKRFRLDGTIRDSLIRRPENREGRTWAVDFSPTSHATFGIPFAPSMMSVPWPNGGLLIGDGSDYTLTVSRTGMDTTLVIARDWVAAPVSDSARQAAFDQLTSRGGPITKVARLSDIPARDVAFRSFQTDDAGRIWVRLPQPRSAETAKWDVFSADGHWLGPVQMPFRPLWLLIRNDRAVAVLADSDGVMRVVIYKIDWGTH